MGCATIIIEIWQAMVIEPMMEYHLQLENHLMEHHLRLKNQSKQDMRQKIIADSITTLESESEGAGIGEDESNKNICDEGEYQTLIVILIEFSMNRGLICCKHGAPIIMQKASVVLIGVKDFEAS
jgi:hypothetical protein